MIIACMLLLFFVMGIGMNWTITIFANEINQDQSNDWVRGEDGKWRKIISVPEFDFNSNEVGIFEILDRPEFPKPIEQWYNNGPGDRNGALQIVENYSDAKSNRGLKFDATEITIENEKPANIRIMLDLPKNISYELEYRFYREDNIGGINIALDDITSQDNISTGSVGDKIVTGPEDGWFEGTLKLEGLQNYLRINIWIPQPTTKVYFDYFKVIAVSNTNPNTIDPEKVPPQRAIEQDLIQPKNAGDFELWGNSGISDEKEEGKSFYREGRVEITNKESQMNNHSVRIEEESSLILWQEGLKADTEYTIFFLSKATDKGNLEFRLSGFKDETKMDYLNGSDGDHEKWISDPKGQSNMYNWIENLKINRNEWLRFRYDFVTGTNPSNSVRAVFTATGGPVYVDGIMLVEREKLEEGVPTLPSNEELSRGHRLLLNHGLQFQSWTTTDEWASTRAWMKVPRIEDIKDIGFTAMQYSDWPLFNRRLHEEAEQKEIPLKWATARGPKGLHISSYYQDEMHKINNRDLTGLPTKEEWENGFLNEKNGEGYLADLVSMSIGDEEDYSDTLIQNLKAWFEVSRKHYPHVLVHHNQVGNSPAEAMKPISTFNKDMLRKYMRTAKPDFLSYDMYYFRERRIEQTKGGTVIPFYDDLNRYRIVSSEGYDGTGEQPIPFGQYHYSWRTGPGAATPLKRGDGWYELTESQINLYAFATWTFGGKWMSNFRWLDENLGYLFTDYRINADGTYKKSPVFDQFKEMIRQSKNVGPHLLRIQNKEVAIVRGQQKRKDGSIVENDKPKDNPDWKDIQAQSINQKVFIQDIQVQNLGQQNDGLNGDVFIGYFEPLNGLTEEDKKVFTSTDPRYFMILNGLTSGDGLPKEMQQGSSYETRQEITITFNLPDSTMAHKLKKVSRVDGGDQLEDQGKVLPVKLQPIGNDQYELTIVIGGGYADLFYWELGDLKSDTSTKEAQEDMASEEIVGQMIGKVEYINDIEKRDLEGRTIRIGYIAGTTKLEPLPRLGRNPNKPNSSDLVDGKEITLTLGGDIAAIGERYYRQDIWEFRMDRIQRDNHVNLEFKEYDWDKETLMNKVKAKQKGEDVSELPDILVVPNEWLWEKDNLVSHDLLLAFDDFDVIDFNESKWNQAYQKMATIGDKTYGLFTDVSLDPTGIFVNKIALQEFNLQYDIHQLQQEDQWTFKELEDIIQKTPTGKKLFADNDHLIRQLLISAGVKTKPNEFDASSEEFKKAINMYQKLQERDLLMEGTLEEQMEAFKKGDLVFIVAPYKALVQHLREAYWYYEDNTTRRFFENFRGWGPQTVTQPEDGNWKITVRQQPAGMYAMPADHWSFMLFPKPSISSDYRSILNRVSYPVMLASTEKPEDVAFILNELLEEYKGVANTEFLTREPLQERIQQHRDLDALQKAALRDGYGDLLAASGIWEKILKPAIQNNPTEYEKINAAVANYFNTGGEIEEGCSWVSIYDNNNEKMLELKPNELIRVKMNKAEIHVEKAIVIVALYGQGNEMVSYKVKVINFEEEEEEVNITTPNDVVGCKLKIMLWDSLDGMQPIVKPAIYYGK